MTLMTSAGIGSGADVDILHAAVEARCHAADAYFSHHAGRVSECAAAMAERFWNRGTLLVFGSGTGVTDAQHNAVEYVHPVLPGCRALPALALTDDVSTVTGILGGAGRDDVYAHQLGLLGRRTDIALALLSGDPVADAPAVRGLLHAAGLEMLTVALSAGADPPAIDMATHVFHAGGVDAATAQELHLATYHMLWELTHIILNHRGIAADRA
ncbi:MAG: phosphoheptose isomerase [Candidatus Dormibacteria bacterium]